MTFIWHHLLLGIHIFLAIIWVGGILFVGWGIYPVARKMPYEEQRVFLQSLMQWTHLIFAGTGIGVITTGILLGTVLGPIKHWETIWNTTYGNIWVTALIIALITLFWGVFIGYKQSMNVFSNDKLWKDAEAGNTKSLNKAMFITAAVESVEVIGFAALIGCMVMLG